jgi:hypothetical protein
LSSEQHNGNTVYRLSAQRGLDENICALGYRKASNNTGPWDGTVELLRNRDQRDLQRWWVIPAERYHGQPSYAERPQEQQQQQTQRQGVVLQSGLASGNPEATTIGEEFHDTTSTASNSTDMLCIGTDVDGPQGSTGDRSRLFHICAVDRRGKHYLSRDSNAPGSSLALWWRAEPSGLQVS